MCFILYHNHQIMFPDIVLHVEALTWFDYICCMCTCPVCCECPCHSIIQAIEAHTLIRDAVAFEQLSQFGDGE